MSPYTVRMPENAEQNNSEYGHSVENRGDEMNCI